MGILVYRQIIFERGAVILDIFHRSNGIPVLIYHSIGQEENNELSMPPNQFKEQMDYLKKAHFTILTLDQVLEFLINDHPIPRKSVLLTFDDGYLDNYTNAFPILKQYDFKATIFIVTGTINQKDKLSSRQMIEMQSDGISFGSHTVNHDDLGTLSYKQQLSTLVDSRMTLEKILGKKIESVAYPFGKYNKTTLTAAQNAGYKIGFTANKGLTSAENGLFTLCRILVSSLDTLTDFKHKLK